MTPTFSYGTLVSTPTGTHSQTASQHFTVNIMQNSKNKEALRIAEWLEGIRGNTWPSYIPKEAAAELRRQHDLLGKADALCRILAARIAELEARLEVDARHPYDGIACRDATIAELQAGYDAARLEIASLHAQLEAVRVGGVEPLSKRECLHQISEPANAGWCDGCSPDNCSGCRPPSN